MSSYSSSLNDAEWAVIEFLLNDYPRKSKPVLRNGTIAFCLMPCFQLKNGCHWVDLPKDFPPYSTVYWHYKQWPMARLHENHRTQT
ncbi:transposase [Beggiatoa leptomitoformis]|uniref:Transposase n=1 Tax=Beggiatoa leptomitoformis TaxID=288004 RepID=A0A2N9YDF8_9GAMM|nr:transposase [Beggiatoa leptomitoformis]AUI68520.1 transposase [Beggiatoa leptomitoformis]QGX03841.1 transposase [Beggiatoa leptomitoformis]